MIVIKEHQKIDKDCLKNFDVENLKHRINYDTSVFDSVKINLIRYEFKPASHIDGFYSYYRIGAEWLDATQTQSLLVLPKITDIDFIRMFMECLYSDLPRESFSSIYCIDFEAKPIQSSVLNAVLSPLLVVNFIMVMKRIADRGLRKGYISATDNLYKIRGRVDIRKNERENIFKGHRERVSCRYSEFSVDTSENRCLKRALRIAVDLISAISHHPAYPSLAAMCNHCLSNFVGVADSGYEKVVKSKCNKLYKDYGEAMRLAQMIIRHKDITPAQEQKNKMDFVPVFRIDMALLFEHYALAIMRKTVGKQEVKYQVKGSRRRFIADFLITKGSFKAIVDAKYIDGDQMTIAKGDYIKQLSGYCRDKVLLHHLGISTDEEASIPLVPCVILYPTRETTQFSLDSLLSQKVSDIVRFYTAPLTIPTLSG